MRYLFILLAGLLVGAGATVFLLGMPRSRAVPGERISPPSASGDPRGTVTISIENSFLEDLLGAIFRDLNAPAFHLAVLNETEQPEAIVPASYFQGCNNTITLAQQGSSTRTQVQFAAGKIKAPLAFSGSYSLVGNCMQFNGWADTAIELRFDQARQTIFGHINVEGVNLEGVNPVANNFVTVFVRDAIDQRVNPLELIGAQQLQLTIPVKASNGAVKATVKDVRSEVLDGSLRLHISYEFAGQRQ